jgi:predicted dithiol-disulfide oxidoreductase (DUF899 family)
MTKHVTGTREEWLEARLKLLEAEKELTRRSDELARLRQELPWVRISKEYRFETDEGSASLADLFRGRSQLLVYHFMFGPDYTAGCPSCSAIADGFNGFVVHLANHDVTLAAVSRAPLAKLQAYKQRMEWTFPWVSSLGGDFNFDFSVSFTEEQQREGIEYNYRREPGWELAGIGESLTKRGEGPVAEVAAMTGTDVATYTRDRPGVSAFVIEEGGVYHTYSTYVRGLDSLWGMYQWLDRAPKGRNESGTWFRRHDEYDHGSKKAGVNRANSRWIERRIRDLRRWLFDRVTPAFETRSHCAVVSNLLILLSRLSIGLLLRCLLFSFVSPAKPTRKSAHGRASSCTFPGVARYRTTHRTQRCSARSAFQNVTFRGAVLLVPGRAWRIRLWFAGIETGLADCP